jgi:hypothetical protein
MLARMEEPRVRLAQLLVGLLLVADVGMGLEPGEAARAAVLAARLSQVGCGAAVTYRLPIAQHWGLTPLLRVGYQPRPGRRRLE